MKLRDYQIEINTKVTTYFVTENKRCCVSLATGAGKTVTFIDLCTKLIGNTLILVNRIELINQTAKAFEQMNIMYSTVTAQDRRIAYSKYCIGMAQTIQSRFKTKKFNYDYYDNIIVDECHRLDYAVSLENFKGNVIGFTATPVLNKKITYETADGRKVSKKIPLSKYYNHLIEGVDIAYLIDNGYLVPEQAYELKSFSKAGLEIDEKTGDYTTKSLNDKFDKKECYAELNQIINDKVRGKKTIIFNPSTIVNEKVYLNLQSAGYNVKMYDSINNTTAERIEVVNWFRNTEGAILCNVNVFTTGFDVKEVECIILNRSTASLSLFIQMSGRGGRTTDKIYKPYFLLIDLGGNIAEFGNWSDKKDWNKMFYDDSERIINETVNASEAYQCQACGNFISPRATICPDCGEPQKRKEKGTGSATSEDIVKTKKVKPDTKKLINFAERNGLDLLSAKKIYFKTIAEMFEDTKVESYLNHKATGMLKKRIKQNFWADYFLFQKSKLDGNRNVKLETFYRKIENEIDKYYKLNTETNEN